MNDRIHALRFKNDNLASAGLHINKAGLDEYQQRLKGQNLLSATKIIPEIFPEIGKALEQVRQRLIPDYKIEAYVTNSSEYQAFCFPGRGKTISIGLTSGLVQLHSTDELCFVIGHELGHHLFGHHEYPDPDVASHQVERLNILALKRAAEISADRVGFVSVSNKDSAFKAVLKLASGLPDRFIRFDVSAFIDQARELRKIGGSEYGLLSTHPDCATRMRALLWFDMSQSFRDWKGGNGNAPLKSQDLDDKVGEDLAAVSGFRLAEINKEEAESAMFWGALSLFVSDGHLSKDEQLLLRQTFGEKRSEDAIHFIKDNGADAVITKFEIVLRSVRLMDEEAKEALYQDLEHFAELAGGGIDVRERVLQKTLRQINLDRVICLK